MPTYEYRCKKCQAEVVSTEHLESNLDESQQFDDWGHEDSVPMWDPFREWCGPLKRTWSVGFQIKSTDWGH